MPKDVTTRGDVVDPTIWMETGFLIRDIGDGVFCVGKCARIRPGDDPGAADLTELILRLFLKLCDCGLIA